MHLGSANPDTIPDLVFSGDENFGNFGNSLTGGRDINADGFSDFMIGANLQSGGGINRGRAYLFAGSTTPSTTPILTLTGNEEEALLGDAVQFPGDVNGDGGEDFLVGASMHDAGGGLDFNAGQVYLYYGGSAFDGTADQTYNGPETDGSFGLYLPRLGDLNRDGFADVSVGAAFMDLQGGMMADWGRIFFFAGGQSPSAAAFQTVSGTAQSEVLGRSAVRLDFFPEEGNDIAIAATGRSSFGNTMNGALDLYQFVPNGPNAAYQFNPSVRGSFVGNEDGANYGTVKPRTD